MQSKITGGETELLFTAKVLNKYDVQYFRCKDTGFIQTETPYWLEESYSSAITKLDIGLPYRNLLMVDAVGKILGKHFNSHGRFLDYAGGYGLFTRLMRDNGYDFYNTDEYCQNFFAEYFDLSDLPSGSTFELTTAFEVFEHLPDPMNEIKLMLQYSDNLLFSTQLQPGNLKTVTDWWYFAPETGQHIAFYTADALSYIARQLGYNFYTDGKSLHLFSKNTFSVNPMIIPRDSFVLRKTKKMVKKAENKIYPKLESLMTKDYEMIKGKLKEGKA